MTEYSVGQFRLYLLAHDLRRVPQVLRVYLQRLDAKVKAAWEAVPKINTQGALVVGHNALETDAVPEVFDIIDRKLSPLHKLAHKWKHDGSPDGTPLARLTGLRTL